MSGRNVVHGSFSLTRSWKARPQRVFDAFATEEGKAKWFGALPGSEILKRAFDFREGGLEHMTGRHANGMVSSFDCIYHDIVAPASSESGRILYSYVMHLNGKKISVSQACIEIRAEGAGTKLVLTEHGDFLDGYDDNGSREHGTNLLMDILGKSVET